MVSTNIPETTIWKRMSLFKMANYIKRNYNTMGPFALTRSLLSIKLDYCSVHVLCNFPNSIQSFYNTKCAVQFSFAALLNLGSEAAAYENTLKHKNI